MRCPFCDRQFDEASALAACRSCRPLGGCRKLRCPHCGYESPRETRLVRLLRRWMRRRGADPPTGEHTAPLTEAPVDAEGVVTALGTRDQREIQKLLAVGILPGVDIRLIRQFPAFVFQVGYSQFTVDRELAGKIIVRWRGRKA